MSNMNAGSFAPDHATHRDGLDVDGWYAGYNARNAATAQTMIGHLNSAYGISITSVFVTFTASPGNLFFQAIQGVVLNDGRLATDVIRSVPGHDTHFHWRFGP
jgi:murein endopeptidase